MYKSGITKILRSIRILSAAGVVGPLAASAMIYSKPIHYRTICEDNAELLNIYLGLDSVSVLFVDNLLDSSGH